MQTKGVLGIKVHTSDVSFTGERARKAGGKCGFSHASFCGNHCQIVHLDFFPNIAIADGLPDAPGVDPLNRPNRPTKDFLAGASGCFAAETASAGVGVIGCAADLRSNREPAAAGADTTFDMRGAAEAIPTVGDGTCAAT